MASRGACEVESRRPLDQNRIFIVGSTIGFVVREVGDDADGNVRTRINVLALVVTVAFIFLGALAEFLVNRRTQ